MTVEGALGAALARGIASAGSFLRDAEGCKLRGDSNTAPSLAIGGIPAWSR